MTRTLLVLFLMLLMATSGFAGDRLSVAAAGDLSFALKELAVDFEHKTGNSLELSFGSSGNLASQIANGAPFDLFLSADVAYARRLIEQGFADESSLYRYGRGTLVLWVPPNSPLDPNRVHQDLLLEAGVRRIAIANPRHAPYGRAAEAALRKWGFYDRVAPKLVFGENISQTAQFVQSGNADAGLIALSLVLPSEMKSGKYWRVPDEDYPPLDQGAVIIKSSKHAAAARGFIDYLKSTDAKAILAKYGFRPE